MYIKMVNGDWTDLRQIRSFWVYEEASSVKVLGDGHALFEAEIEEAGDAEAPERATARAQMWLDILMAKLNAPDFVETPSGHKVRKSQIMAGKVIDSGLHFIVRIWLKSEAYFTVGEFKSRATAQEYLDFLTEGI